eukprot:SAG31_NODE_42_length_31262_cov_46.416231_8_plen_124_part_00
MYSNTMVKITDFGFAKNQAISDAMTKCGTMAYMPPEIAATSTLYAAYDGMAADMWSCGVILFVLVLRDFPYGSEGRELVDEQGRTRTMTRADVCRAILSGSYVVDPAQVRMHCPNPCYCSLGT